MERDGGKNISRKREYTNISRIQYEAREKGVILLLGRARHFRYKHVEIRPLYRAEIPRVKMSHLCGITFMFF